MQSFQLVVSFAVLLKHLNSPHVWVHTGLMTRPLTRLPPWAGMCGRWNKLEVGREKGGEGALSIPYVLFTFRCPSKSNLTCIWIIVKGRVQCHAEMNIFLPVHFEPEPVGVRLSSLFLNSINHFLSWSSLFFLGRRVTWTWLLLGVLNFVILKSVNSPDSTASFTDRRHSGVLWWYFAPQESFQ